MEHSDMLARSGHRFFYDDTLFCPGTDTFLLSAFPRLRHGLAVCDLGSGTGLLGLLLLRRQPDLHVTGVEILPQAVRLTEKAIACNHLSDRLSVLEGDLRRIQTLLPAGSFDLVVCNPPYYPVGSGRMPGTRPLQAARSEADCTLDEVCAAAAWLLRWGGSFCLVHKPERLTDLLCALRGRGLEPKRLRMVCPQAGAAPSLVLAEGRRGGRPGLSIQPPLLLQGADGGPSPELDSIYFRQQEDNAP